MCANISLKDDNNSLKIFEENTERERESTVCILYKVYLNYSFFMWISVSGTNLCVCGEHFNEKEETLRFGSGG